jgi:hypothetical protein
MNKPTPTRYALFAWYTEEKKKAHHGWSISDLCGDSDGEEWKEGDPEPEKPKEVLGFVAFVATPQEVIAEVRKNPTRRYVLMTGTVEKLEVAIPVFVGGKNLATMNKEWDV